MPLIVNASVTDTYLHLFSSESNTMPSKLPGMRESNGNPFMNDASTTPVKDFILKSLIFFGN